MDEYIEKEDIRITDDYVFFYKACSPLSNFYKTLIVWPSAETRENVVLHSSEQIFMAEKAWMFSDKETYEKILKCKDPAGCKRLGRKVANYSNAVWRAHRYHVMCEALRAKFRQTIDMIEYIRRKDFRGKCFVEASPSDIVWGIGLGIHDDAILNKANWKGSNLLGKALDRIREELEEVPPLWLHELTNGAKITTDL